mmetsp:Transcript_113310/g.353223  ORF Transcript_113310/g.353223 Transcript_113310/m.353223 type:complete len:325 (-) Transcript_113310:946-1920(-)
MRSARRSGALAALAAAAALAALAARLQGLGLDAEDPRPGVAIVPGPRGTSFAGSATGRSLLGHVQLEDLPIVRAGHLQPHRTPRRRQQDRLANQGKPVQRIGHKATYGSVVALGHADGQPLGDVLNLGRAAHRVAASIHALDHGAQLASFQDVLLLVRVVDLAHDLLHHVLQGDQAGGASKLVHADGDLLALQDLQGPVQGHRLRHEERLVAYLLHRRPGLQRRIRSACSAQVPEKRVAADDAHDAIHPALVHGDAAELGLQPDPLQLRHLRRGGNAGHVDEGGHHLLHPLVVEVADVYHHLSLRALHDAALDSGAQYQVQLLL